MVQHKRPEYVQVVTDRYGKQHLYFRHPRKPRKRLPGPLYSEQFWTAYHRACEVKNVDNGISREIAGSISALISQYYKSSSYTALGPSTKSTYSRQIEPFRAKYGHLPVSQVKPKHIDQILGDIAKTSTAQAHKMRKRLLKLMALSVTWEYRDDNPMLLAQKIKHKEKGWRTWTEGDIETYRAHWKAGTPKRIALEILLHTGLRRSDAVRLGRQHRQGNKHVISIKKSGETINAIIPVHPTLEAHLPKTGLTYIVTERGVGRSEKAFTNWIINAAKEAGLPPHSSPHGLRKAMCKRLADAGCTSAEISAITGQSIVVIERYIREYNRDAAAEKAMAKVKDPL